MKVLIKKFFNFYHLVLSFLGNIIYFFPSNGIFVLGVTGTKGKSSTLEMISYVLEKKGFKTALISSVKMKINELVYKNRGNSMPGRFFLKKFLNLAKKNQCQFALIEVTSEGVVQHRHKFINFDAAMFLNLSPEHIESHGSFKNYLLAKVSFFEYVINHSNKPNLYFIVNQLDENSSFFKEVVLKNKKKNKQIIEFNKNSFKEKFFDKITNDWLKSDFNLENMAAAYSFLKIFNFSDEELINIFNQFPGLEGRFEMIVEKPFKVIIDYAHTPNSLELVYQLIKEKYLKSGKKIVGLLGSAGGGRDKWKREKMGEIAGKYLDYVIITNEDPYDEDPLEIIYQIEKGAKKYKDDNKIIKVLDRYEAIKTGLKLLNEEDVFILTGKGSESFIHLKNNKKIPWQEKDKVLEAFQEIYGKI